MELLPELAATMALVLVSELTVVVVLLVEIVERLFSARNRRKP